MISVRCQIKQEKHRTGEEKHLLQQSSCFRLTKMISLNKVLLEKEEKENRLRKAKNKKQKKSKRKTSRTENQE